MGRELFAHYEPLAGPDEMFGRDGSIKAPYRDFSDRLAGWDVAEYHLRQSRADLAMLNAGITFTVYSDEQGTERIFPFSLIPRIVSRREWAHVEAGLIQRVRALNLFLRDVYNEQRSIRDGVIPGEVVFGAPEYSLRMADFEPPLGVYAHVAGVDLVRDASGRYVVLEDNLRTPSGVSYVLENRTVMVRVAPDLFPGRGVAPVGDYPSRLHMMLMQVRPAGVAEADCRAVILTPGIYNSAYFEHSFLAQQMGIPLVEGVDLVTHDDRVFLRSTSGLERVHVIYRRVDDAFLDPLAFRPNSMLGVSGLMSAYRAGNVTVVNAVGTGVADDKVVYRFVPDLVRYFLGEEPLLPSVETYAAVVPEELAIIRKHARDLVLKPANASGGYGVVIGPQASDDRIAEVLQAIEAEPRQWIAQPLQEFSTIPTFQDDRLRPRRADLRPYVLSGETTWVLPGGLTRVALRPGSYVVNSSQGGGSKDTWVLTDEGVDADGPGADG
ncbi:MAG: circularly permuted type 2 ATP-grasp protein [Chloroflexi bacterium]|nr:circularly permuted type 2 ATP-grasp protein [Chloroflexota bacterium]